MEPRHAWLGVYMRWVVLLFGFFFLTACVVIMPAASAQTGSPVVTVPMTPIAEWPPAAAWQNPANAPAGNQAAGNPATGNQMGAYAAPNANQVSGVNQAGGATTPPQPNVNTSLNPVQAGADHFAGVDSVYRVPVNEVGLADAAREARQKVAKDRPKVFTNDDVARLRRAAGEPPVGISPSTGPVANEQTMPASDVTAPTAPNMSNRNNEPNAQQNSGQQNSNGVQNNMPAGDQTTPPAPMNQNQPKRSPFRRKQ